MDRRGIWRSGTSPTEHGGDAGEATLPTDQEDAHARVLRLTTACDATARAAQAWYQVVLETPVESPARIDAVERFSTLAALLFGSVPVETLRRVRGWAQERTGITLSPATPDSEVLQVQRVMLDFLVPSAATPTPATAHRGRARSGPHRARVWHGRRDPARPRVASEPSPERSALRQAAVHGSRAMTYVYSPALVDAAHGEARRQLELRAPRAGERVPITGLDAEDYAATGPVPVGLWRRADPGAGVAVVRARSDSCMPSRAGQGGELGPPWS